MPSAATSVKPRGDRLGVAERALDLARYARHREEDDEDEERMRCEAQKPKARRKDDDARERHPADAPAVHHHAEHRHGKGTEDFAKRQRERGGASVPVHVGHDRLQKHAKRKGKHRPIADKEPGDGADDNPPGVLEPELHAFLPSRKHGRGRKSGQRARLLSAASAAAMPVS
jgi:hypothetical protein